MSEAAASVEDTPRRGDGGDGGDGGGACEGAEDEDSQ